MPSYSTQIASYDVGVLIYLSPGKVAFKMANCRAGLKKCLVNLQEDLSSAGLCHSQSLS
jgi:hypothetical protein